MKKEQISELFERFENARYLLEGVECWSALELQTVFNYSEWRNFTKVIDKARESCENAGIPVSDHFVDVNKMVTLAKGAQRQVSSQVAFNAKTLFTLVTKDFSSTSTLLTYFNKVIRLEREASRVLLR